MYSLRTSFRIAGALVSAIASAIPAQVAGPSFSSIPPLAFDTTGPVIQAHAEPLKPFTVAGERGVLVGRQDGVFEAWLLPVKLLSHLTIEADIEGYRVPIDVNREAAEIEVRPDRTVITYSHPGFTVRQIMFSPSGAVPDAGPETGPLVLFEFDCLHPTDFTLRFTPELRWMWPERNEGVPGAEWVDGQAAPYGAGGYYVLHTDYPNLAGAVTIPGATPGIMAPYQERPQVHPVELKLHIDPLRDHGRLFPLLMAVGMSPATATSAALGTALERLNSSIASQYEAEAESYMKLLSSSAMIDTPDKALNEAFEWAVVSIEQLRARVPGPQQGLSGSQQALSGSQQGAPAAASVDTAAPQPVPAPPGADAASPQAPAAAVSPDVAPQQRAPATENEIALVAGYFSSGDSARPGFGWFFGRDALYALYAVNGFGDFALAKDELEFLIRRQRADGKIMHEYSQVAASIDWQSFSYMYAAADSTPLFLLAVDDYVRASGDVTFLTAHRDAIEKAWAFETAHQTEGVCDNSQGTGWVESWPGGMPHQEIYLALLDQQASGAVADMETLLESPDKSTAAAQRADGVAKIVEQEYYDSEKSCYDFSRNLAKDGTAVMDRTSTVYPALAWWTGTSILAHPEGCLRQFAAHTLDTDWGLRDVANDEKFYDGMSYHQGSVWPLFTGWAAMAEYRGSQPLAGYQLLMENANLTRAQDLGAVTELLSGDFFVPFGRSTSHQLWSSAMVITPTLRGLFGIAIDAQKKTVTVNPHLPADWSHAEVRNLPLPGGPADLLFRRRGGDLVVSFARIGDPTWQLRSDQPGATAATGTDSPAAIAIPLPAIEIALPHHELPLPGARNSQFRVVSEAYGDHKLEVVFEGLADSAARFTLIRHIPVDLSVHSPVVDDVKNGAVLIPFENAPDTDTRAPFDMQLHFPPGEGWKTVKVTMNW